MTDSCYLCYTEPIDDTLWYRCQETMEVICPWCVKDMYNNKKKIDEVNAMWEQWNMNIDTIKKLQAKIVELEKK